MAVAYVNVKGNAVAGQMKGMKLEEPDGAFRSQSDKMLRPPKTPGPYRLAPKESVPQLSSTLYTPTRQPQHQSHNTPTTEAKNSWRQAYTSIRQFSHKVELYRGSVSTVYKAMDSNASIPVVVKAYHKKKMAEKHYHKLEREVKTMMLMTGPYVAELYSCFADDDNIYLIMEFCEGGDLFKHLLMRGGKLDEHYVCVEIIAPLLRVLEKCHSLRMMHRDIKPENIFLSRKGKLRLGDWGLAINFEEELPFSRSGTLDYMAPEVLKNPASQLQESPSVELSLLSAKNIKPYTSKVDIWAVGVLAYELVCGKPPFEVEDESQTASLIMYSDHLKFPLACTAEWCDFVKCALIKDPKKRPDANTLLEHPWVQHNLTKAINHAEGHRTSKEELLMALPLRPVKKALFQDPSKTSAQTSTAQAPPSRIPSSRPQHQSSMGRTQSSGISYEKSNGGEKSAAAHVTKMLQQPCIHPLSGASTRGGEPNKVPSASVPVSPHTAEKTAAAVNAAMSLRPALSEPEVNDSDRPETVDATAQVMHTPRKPEGLSALMQFGKRLGCDDVPPSPHPSGPGIKARMMFHLRQQQPKGK
eukprot:gene17650-23995_t